MVIATFAQNLHLVGLSAIDPNPLKPLSLGVFQPNSKQTMLDLVQTWCSSTMKKGASFCHKAPRVVGGGLIAGLF
jgi:hypothetical protein